MSRGVVYIAMGEDFVREASCSARILKRNVGDIPICVISDQSISSPHVDSTVTVENPAYGFVDKILHISKSPYDRTLYLDTDTYVCSDISELFAILNEFDLAAAHVPHWDKREGLELETVPESFPEYNTGVISYRNSEKTDRLFDEWEREFFNGEYPEYGENQLSFRKVLYHSDLRVATLPPEYNCRYQCPNRVARDVKIFHGRLCDITTPGVGHQLDIERVVEQINDPDQPRVFYQKGGRGPPDRGLVVRTNDQPLSQIVVNSLRQDGVRATLWKIIKKLYE